jgi:hypothetical protein
MVSASFVFPRLMPWRNRTTWRGCDRLVKLRWPQRKSFVTQVLATAMQQISFLRLPRSVEDVGSVRII